MIEKSIERIMNGKYLRFQDIKELVENIRNGGINGLQLVSFLAAMETRNRINGINAEESANFIRALRVPDAEQIEGLLCNAGTGGDKVKTINVGTSAAIVIAAAGIKVLKIGYKGVTSRCGSRDLLQGWGINPFQSIEEVIKSTKAIGIGYYDFSKLVVNESRSGFRSPLHYLGPLCHPLKLTYKILGCINRGHLNFSESVLEKVCDSYMLTFNPDIDEISPVSKTVIVERKNRKRRIYSVEPKDFDLKKIDYYELGHPENKEDGANLVDEVFQGVESPRSELVAINAGAGIYLAKGLKNLREGYEEAKEVLKSGRALCKLDEWQKLAGRVNE